MVGGKVLGISNIGKYEGVKYNGVDKYYMQRKINDTTMEVCRSAGGICIDLAAELYFEDSDFYDFNHTVPEGAAKIGHYLCDKLSHFF